MSNDSAGWSKKEIAFLRKLSSPNRIQEFLDSIPYRLEDDYCCPRDVITDRKANCFDGSLFAAAALRCLGHNPLLVDLRAVDDDDHVIAVFKIDNCWGAIAKSNFPGLRWREPVYRDLRELVMSYFEAYFNLQRKRTLREYSLPLNLKHFDSCDWMFSRNGLLKIARALDTRTHKSILTPAQRKRLTRIDKRSLAASLVGMNTKGTYRSSKTPYR